MTNGNRAAHFLPTSQHNLDRIADRYASLRGFAGDATALARLPVSSSETVARFEKEFDALENAEAELRDEREAIDRKLDELTGILARLGAGGEVPTSHAIAAARHRRDAAWHCVRRRFVEDADVSAEDWRDCFADHDPVEIFEELVATADALVDRRGDEAGRAAEHALTIGRRASAHEILNRLAAGITEVNSRRAATEAAWRAELATCGLEPLPPAEMAAWLEERTAILEQRNALAEMATTSATKEALVEDASRALRELADELETPFGVELALRENIDRVENTLEALERAATTYEARQTRRIERQQALDRVRQDRADLAADCARFQASWRGALPNIGLPIDSDLDTTEAALAGLTQARQLMPQIQSLERRIGRMDEETNDFAEKIASLAGDLRQPTSGDWRKDTPALLDRLALSRTRKTQREGLETRLRDDRAKLVAAETALLQLESEGRGLVALGGVDTLCDLPPVIEQAVRKRTLKETVQKLRGRLRTDAAGFDEGQLRAAAQAVDLDALNSRLADLDTQIEDLDIAAEAAAQEVTAARAEVENLKATTDASIAAQQQNDALAEMRSEATEWIRYRAAGLLLRAAVERYRQQHQGPIVERASGLFAILTGGSMAGLEVTIDKDDRPDLAGRRSDGVLCPRTGMSDGTTDQLYLALRLAAIEDYCGRAEPLPFIGDDILVNFDDRRAEAGLKALAELGSHCQVLVFTHHQHLAALAKTTVDEDVAILKLQ